MILLQMKTNKKFPNSTKYSPDVNRMLSMLEDLTVESKVKSKSGNTSNVSAGSLKESSNLLEISYPDIVVEILDNGCRVTCIPCKQYFVSRSKKGRYDSIFCSNFIFTFSKTLVIYK